MLSSCSSTGVPDPDATFTSFPDPSDSSILDFSRTEVGLERFLNISDKVQNSNIDNGSLYSYNSFADCGFVFGVSSGRK